jgi:phytoene dehydrogenase-like protein
VTRAAGTLDAIVVGSGPNGLTAAITLARAGRRVHVIEAGQSPGGGVRSASLTLPGFVHDVCSAVYPMAAGSPVFRALPLATHGLEWVEPDLALAHPLEDGRAGVVARSLADTVAHLEEDGAAYAALVGDLVERWRSLLEAVESGGDGRPVSGQRRRTALWRVVRPGRALLRTGSVAARSAAGVASSRLRTEVGRALWAGLAAHGMQPLDRLATGGFALSLAAAAHVVGWPLVRGGAQRLTDALLGVLRAAGGTIETGHSVRSLEELPAARAVLLDTSPAQLLRLASDRFPGRYRRWLGRFRRGPAAFKLDYALAAPIPWRAEACRRAGVVHVGGTLPEIARALEDACSGRLPARPFVLVAQPTLCDRSRVPSGTAHHVAWAYCLVPRGSPSDASGAIEAQIERFAPGFRDCVLARHIRAPATLEADNANLEGGDIGGGACDWRQLLVRPAPRLSPWSTPDPRLFLCSASTPPGPGVHGVCGYLAARAALRGVLDDRS